jgi:ribosome-associated heat shock protein Hsp15
LNDDSPAARHRIDRWLWCTRFFKTRSAAAQAVSGGKVHMNGDRVKPAHGVQVGDQFGLMIGGVLAEFEVQGLPVRRGPATEAQACYSEQPASIARRAKHREAQRLADLSRPRSTTRPDKRDRRKLMRFQRGEG